MTSNDDRGENFTLAYYIASNGEIMRTVVSVLMLLTVCVAPAAAGQSAADPILSGTYAVSLIRLCQQHLNLIRNPSTGDVTNVDATQGGDFHAAAFSATFDPTTGTVTQSGTEDVLGLMNVDNTAPPAAEFPIATTQTYSNTATTLTVGSDTVHIVYGHVNHRGVAQSATFVGISVNSPTCWQTGVATHQ